MISLEEAVEKAKRFYAVDKQGLAPYAVETNIDNAGARKAAYWFCPMRTFKVMDSSFDNGDVFVVEKETGNLRSTIFALSVEGSRDVITDSTVNKNVYDLSGYIDEEKVVGKVIDISPYL